MENGVQMIKILWSIHNSAWLLIWMDMLFDRRKYIDSDKKFMVNLDYLFRSSYMSVYPVFSGFPGILDTGRSSHIPL